MREADMVLEDRRRQPPVEVLARVAPALHGPSPLDDKLAWLAEAARSVTGAALATYIGFGVDPERRTAAAGVASYDVDTLVRPVVVRRAGGPAAAVVPTAEDLAPDRRWRSFLDRAGLPRTAGVLAVEVPAADRGAHGVLLACCGRPDGFSTDDRRAVEALAAHAAVALDNEARLARLTELQEVQREVVHQLQEAVRPPVPSVEAAELGVHFLPADPSAPTGGDLHDWLVLPDGDVFLTVVDVMGKGVAATKDAVAVTHALRLLVLDGCPIGELIARADTLLTAHNPDLVATVIAARYRTADGRLWLAGGGQPPALWVSAAGDVRLVAAPGVALGWPGAGSSTVVELALERNDTIVLYTDGLIESTKDVLVGLQNLTRAAAQIARYPSTHVARALVERSLSGAMRRDDSLALALRRRTPPEIAQVAPLGPFEYRFSPSVATIPIGRHLLADWLELLAVEEAERADLLLVASELCSNAVRHATGAPRSLALRAYADGDAVVIEVEDDGEGFHLGARYDDEVPDPELERGRGLYVVEALTDDVAVRREGDRTVVRVVRRAVLPQPR
jgi:serine phosphatase RsbU (regulator of sigma subunit)/anti-sigma regulatory factor (Ser/Thr protein kinase)